MTITECIYIRSKSKVGWKAWRGVERSGTISQSACIKDGLPSPETEERKTRLVLTAVGSWGALSSVASCLADISDLARRVLQYS